MRDLGRGGRKAQKESLQRKLNAEGQGPGRSLAAGLGLGTLHIFSGMLVEEWKISTESLSDFQL